MSDGLSFTRRERPADLISQLHTLRERLTHALDRAKYYDEYPAKPEAFILFVEETRKVVANSIRVAERGHS